MAGTNRRSLNLRFTLFLLVFLAAENFFNPFGVVSSSTGKTYFGIFSILAFLYAYRYGINLRYVDYPRKSFRYIIFGMICSIFMVLFFQNQSLISTLITTVPFLFAFLFFITVMKFNMPAVTIEETLKWLTVASAFMYLVNLWALPDRIFGEERDLDMTRGFVRLGVPMIVTVVTFFFYCINHWLIDGKTKWLWWIAFSSILIVMTLTRQVILVSFVLGLFYIMKRAAMWKRLLVIMFCVVIFVEVLPRLPFYETMLELSEEEVFNSRNNEENIRVTAWKFYIHDYQTNGWTYIFGNGLPQQGKSPWGIREERIIYREYGGNGCIRADVGWAGFFWIFGSITTLCLVIFLIKTLVMPKDPLGEYLNYCLIYVIITSFASGILVHTNQIIELTFILYLCYYRRNVTYSNSNPKLQQLRGYH